MGRDRAIVVALAIATVVVAGCAGGSAASVAPSTGAPSTAAPSGEELPMPSLQSGKPGVMPPSRDPIQVTGVVEAGVEHGCIVLRSDAGLYQLMGATDPLIQPGARVTVVGRTMPDMVTTCQQGTPLEVVEVRTAE